MYNFNFAKHLSETKMFLKQLTDLCKADKGNATAILTKSDNISKLKKCWQIVKLIKKFQLTLHQCKIKIINFN